MSKVRMVTKRNRGRSMKQVVEELNPIFRGWFNYFKWASCKRILNDIDGWIRRKLRCYRLKQCKNTIAVNRFQNSLGVRTWQSWILTLLGRGWWRKSSSPQSHQAMNLQWFDKLGLYNMSINYEKFRVN